MTNKDTQTYIAEFSKDLYDDILILHNGAGSFTPDQIDGFCIRLIHVKLEELVKSYARNMG